MLCRELQQLAVLVGSLSAGTERGRQGAAGNLSAAAFAESLLAAAVEVDSAAAVRQSQQAAATAVGTMLAVVEGSVVIVENFV